MLRTVKSDPLARRFCGIVIALSFSLCDYKPPRVTNPFYKRFYEDKLPASGFPKFQVLSNIPLEFLEITESRIERPVCLLSQSRSRR